VPEPHVVDLGDYEISTDKQRLDLDRVEAFMRQSYWAYARPRAIIEKSIAGSLCLGVYRKADGLQVGFCRLVTDYATFGWLADVFIDEACRGEGLGVALIRTLTNLPEIEGIRLVLGTADAHGLYAKFGFEPLHRPDRWMVRPDREPPPLL